MIKDCLEPYYTPQERLTVTEHQLAFTEGRQKANAALAAYIKAHPPTEGTMVNIPGPYVNDAFAEYNAAVEAWEKAREPVIKRYAAGKTDSELVQDAKEILRGIRQKDIDHHPFSKSFLAETDPLMDNFFILLFLLAPQVAPLQERCNTGSDPEASEAALCEISDTILRKCHRIKDKEKKGDAAHD